MSSINTIRHQAFAVSSYKGEELSTSTKMRLEALGIDPSSVTSEAQANILIAQAEAAQNQNNSGKQQQGGNSSQLISDIKNLAQKVGASVSEGDSTEDMLDKISQKINVMAKDPSQANRVKEYQAELTSLAERANVIVQIQQNIFNTMDMISVSNKLILGL